jgi:exonuclease III
MKHKASSLPIFQQSVSRKKRQERTSKSHFKTMESKVSVLWWNVHNLRDVDHAARIVSHVKEADPDVFALGEVIGDAAYRHIAREFPQYSFYMTFGKQAQEMLVGVRRTTQVFFSQRTEFQSGNEFLRPAALITISVGDPPLNILFAHLKSFQKSLDLGYRDAFFSRIGRLKATLDELSHGAARFVICGDFNLQGMNYLQQKLIKPEDELRHIQHVLSEESIVFATPSHGLTWSNEPDSKKEAALDFVTASIGTRLMDLGDERARYQVRVAGWPLYPEGSEQRIDFLKNISDHASLYFEILS